MRFSAFILIAGLLFTGLTAGAPQHVYGQTVPKKIPVSVIADKLDYDRTTDVYIAVGHVKIEQEGVRLEADKVVMDNKTGEAMAEGKVYLQDGADVIRAEKLRVNLSTRDGVITGGDMFMKKDNLHVKGDTIERTSETVYHVTKGVVTTCDENEWYLKADELNIDMDRYATGTGVTFNLIGMPVFYTPYFLFPVRRQSGLLIPEVGHSSKEGFFANNALFWAISDYKDMTLYSDYREQVGHGTGIEYRYMNSRESSGQMYYKYFDLLHTGESRWELQFQHKEEFAEDLSARADINLVSDEHYYKDFERKLELRSRPYLDSNAFYVERWNTAALYVLGQYSIDLTRTNEKTVQKLPEIRYTIFDEVIAGPLHLNFEGSAVNFVRRDENSVRRVDFNPRLSAVFGSGGLSVTPHAGFEATFYDQSDASTEPVERKFFYTGADINARVSRVFGKDGGTGIGMIRHSIEPTISYTYIPDVDQKGIPQFDSIDSVAARNLTTVALVNRLTAHYREHEGSPTFQTFDLMVLRLSQTYDLNVARANEPGTARARSELLGELYARTPRLFTLSANGTYNTYTSVLTSHSEGAGLTTDRFSLNLTHRYLREPETEFIIGGGGFKFGKWDVSAQWWRDMQKKETTQEEYRIHYGSQCWGIRTSYVIKPGERQFMATLDLRGFGGKSIGGI